MGHLFFSGLALCCHPFATGIARLPLHKEDGPGIGSFQHEKEIVGLLGISHLDQLLRQIEQLLVFHARYQASQMK